MRRSLVATCTLSLALVIAAGCTRNQGKASADATPTLSAQESALKYTQCMRAHGVQIDDPQFQGNQIQLGDIKETDQAKIQTAEQACQQYKPGGGTNGNPPAEKIELLRQLARCMRDNGVENFPDPNANGKMPVDDSVRKDPQFEAAQNICLKQTTPSGSSS
jgi:hypothetical protein